MVGLLGLQSDVGGFAVRLAMMMNWPLRAVCLHSAHVNGNRTRASSLSPSTLALLRRAVSDDAKVYAAAERLHERHMRRRLLLSLPSGGEGEEEEEEKGARFRRLRAEFDSPAFKKACAEQWRDRAKRRRREKASGATTGC